MKFKLGNNNKEESIEDSLKKDLNTDMIDVSKLDAVSDKSKKLNNIMMKKEDNPNVEAVKNQKIIEAVKAGKTIINLDEDVNNNDDKVVEDSLGFTINKNFKFTKEEFAKDIEKRTGRTEIECEKDIKDSYDDCINQIEYVQDSLKESAENDINLLFNSVISQLFNMSSYESFNTYRQILKRFEKIIIDTDTTFYNKTESEKNSIIDENINKYFPIDQLATYTPIIKMESDNSMGIWNKFIDKSISQDFILAGSFINIRYTTNDFIVVKIPSWMVEICTMAISHFTINYAHINSCKFDSQNAILDQENLGYRFNMIHNSLTVNREDYVFIRKNIINNSPVSMDHYFEKTLDSILVDKDYDYNIGITDASIDKLREDQKIGNIDTLRNLNDNEVEAIIKIIMQETSNGSYLIAGTTGSGKTTFLKQILTNSKKEPNLVTIEDTKELNIDGATSYLTNSKYKINDIFKSTLRMNPSRVVVGETRDQTIIDIIETCLTAKSATTLHARSFEKLLTRIKLMVKGTLSTDDLYLLICSAFDIIFIMDCRKITGIYIRNTTSYNGDIFKCYDRLI